MGSQRRSNESWRDRHDFDVVFLHFYAKAFAVCNRCGFAGAVSFTAREPANAGDACNPDQSSAPAFDHRIDKCMESRCHCKDIGIENFVKDVQVFAILRFYADRNTCAGNGDRRMEFRIRKFCDQFFELVFTSGNKTKRRAVRGKFFCQSLSDAA